MCRMIAIVLIKTETGSAFSACGEICKIDGIERCHVVTGPYDLVAVLNSQTISLRVVIAAIHDARGVRRTETCIALA